MYIIYYPDTDENEIRGEVFKVFPNEKLYNDFLELYDYIESDYTIFDNVHIIENKKRKKFTFGRVFFVEKVENNDIIDNDNKLLKINELS